MARPTGRMRLLSRPALGLLILAFPLMISPPAAQAYVGPGAGIAFVSSLFIILISFALSFFTLITFPFRWALQLLRGRRAYKRSRVRRVIVLGLDGQDPELTEAFMSEGLLPNFSRLQASGSYRRLETTLPAESPVAWSSFQTGCNPGRHRVFDFLVPNRHSYLPQLCSAQVEPPARSLKLGRYRIPIGKPRMRLERKSRAFWSILGDHGIFSNILRVPVSFPPEKFRGVLLSAMSVPDLLGTQGTFTYFTGDAGEAAQHTGGRVETLEARNGAYHGNISGPPNPIRADQKEMSLPFSVQPREDRTELRLDGQILPLPVREFTPWVPVVFKAGLGVRVRGMVRFYWMGSDPHPRLYMSPINIDPERPALPVSHPLPYGIYLAKTQGRFCTLGLSEDTWALNERVIDEEAFLKQTYLVHEERRRMFFDALRKTRRGAVACVFDITDRLQHMFWRYLESDHPANPGKDTTLHRSQIRKLYQEMDELVGEVLAEIDEETVLFVMSDHGFKGFRVGVNLNSWLHQNGFLALPGPARGAEWFEGVQWEETQAYAVGLGGIYLNLEGREAKGTVKRGAEAQRIKAAIQEGLRGLIDPETGRAVVGEVYDTRQAYSGPYVAEAPDLIVGFRPGYRVSWTCATGAVTSQVLEPNTKSWSGDHCMNPPEVPGILFCNRPVPADSPRIIDIAPTILDLFGVPIPHYCDGRSLMPEPAPSGGVS